MFQQGVIRTKTRKAFLSLIVLALLAVVLQSFVFSGADFIAGSANTATAFQAGTLSHVNSHNGTVVLAVTDLRPGQISSTGSLTLTGTGTLSGDYTISKAGVVDTPASPGLSNALNLIIEDTTGAPATLYNGPISAFTTLAPGAAGTIAPTQARSYRFSLEFPIGAADPNLQGDGMTLTLQFTGVTL